VLRGEDDGVELSELYSPGRSSVALTVSPSRRHVQTAGGEGAKGRGEGGGGMAAMWAWVAGLPAPVLWGVPALLLLGVLVGGVAGIAAIIFACKDGQSPELRGGSRDGLD
jgi:hypothetical protein